MTLYKLKCVITYDGSGFHGYQRQPRQRTVQGEIERALKRINQGNLIETHCSGRTDAGVHALGQVFHFETELNIPVQQWKFTLNNSLPDDIYLEEVQQVPLAFHARYWALEKEYHYFILNEKKPNVFRKNYVYQDKHDLNREAMKEACQYFIGEHDFTTFSSAKSTVRGSKIREITHLELLEQGNEIELIFKGTGFLYHMVRIIAGVILDVGKGLIKAEDIPGLFDAKNRSLVGLTLPPEGLYLWEVSYPHLSEE